MGARNQEEFRLQCVVADWLAYAVDQDDCPHTHLPFGENRSAKTGARLKRMGTQRGWPDFMFLLPKGRYGCIELKTEQTGQTLDQEWFELRVQKLGGLYAICCSLAEVEGTLKAWGVRIKARAA